MVEFEFAIKKNIVVGINSVDPEMGKASVLGGKGRSVETTWHLQVMGLESLATTARAGSWLRGVCEGARIEKRGDAGPGRMDKGCFLETLTQIHSGMKMLYIYIYPCTLLSRLPGQWMNFVSFIIKFTMFQALC